MADSLKKKLWNVISQARTTEWLLRLLLGSLVAAKAVIPSGFLENPFIPLAYFFGVILVTGLFVKAVKFGWRKLNPPTITIELCRGSDASLVLSPSLDGKYYGTCQILNSDFGSQRPFDMYWDDSPRLKGKYIRSKDKATIVLAIKDKKSDPATFYYRLGGAVIQREPLRHVTNRKLPLEWRHVRTEFRCDQSPHVWNHEYRFRLGKGFRFEIEEVEPTLT